MILFPPYRLDVDAQRLWRETSPVDLRPKTWSLLRYLAERPGRLVTKDELAGAIWGQSVVSDDALTRTLGELRRVLDDDARVPRYVETVHGRGFRFIASLSPATVTHRPSRSAVGGAVVRTDLIGRGAELARLTTALTQAQAGQRQTIFITGGPGDGKSTLIHSFLESIRTVDPQAAVAWGQCIAHFGSREPYMPVLEALERLHRASPDPRLAERLQSIAPSWIAQSPGDGAGSSGAAMSIGAGTTQHRVLREFANLVEAISIDRTVVIALEDLHWSDFGTIDLVSVLAQRPEPARVLIVASYRPLETVVDRHPVGHLVASLRARGLCGELALDGLSPDDVAAYLENRLGSGRVGDAVAALVHTRTNGHPLFMVSLVTHLVDHGQLIERDRRWELAGDAEDIGREVPDDLRHVLEEQLLFTTVADQAVLKAAAVAGETFDAREVAAALDEDAGDVEIRCDAMCRTHYVLRFVDSAHWPDRSMASRYAFVHAAYQQALYDRLPTHRRMRLHQRIGECLERGYADNTGDVACELAYHFQRSYDLRRAVRYLGEAARRAYERRAYRDVAAAIEPALQLLAIRERGDEPPEDEVPPPGSRDLDALREELQLRQLHAIALAHTHGYTSAPLGENLRVALGLCERTHDPAARFDILYALANLHSNQADCETAAKLCDDLQRLKRHPAVRAPWRADYATGVAALWSGDVMRTNALFMRAQGAPTIVQEEIPRFGVEPVVGARSHQSLRTWVAGNEDAARRLQQETTVMAERLGHPFTLAQALTFDAVIGALCERWPEVLDLSRRALAVSTEYGYPRWAGASLVCRGVALVHSGDVARGLDSMGQGFEALQQSGLRLGLSLLTTLQAGAYLHLANWADGLAAVDRGLAHCRETTERLFESELWRLRGELLALAGRQIEDSGQSRAEAHRCMRRALTRARAQRLSMFEQRARNSLKLRRAG